MSYIYDATITLRIGAESLDEAWHKARAAAERANDGDTMATTSLLSLKHRHDLDGSLRGDA